MPVYSVKQSVRIVLPQPGAMKRKLAAKGRIEGSRNVGKTCRRESNFAIASGRPVAIGRIAEDTGLSRSTGGCCKAEGRNVM